MDPREVIIRLMDALAEDLGVPIAFVPALCVAWCQGAAAARFAPAWAEAIRLAPVEDGAGGDEEMVQELVARYPIDPVALAHARGLLAKEGT